MTAVERTGLEPVRTPQAGGWLSPAEARDFLRETFGATVSARTIQAWARDPKRPLRAVMIGRRLLVHRADLLERVGGSGGAAACTR